MTTQNLQTAPEQCLQQRLVEVVDLLEQIIGGKSGLRSPTPEDNGGPQVDQGLASAVTLMKPGKVSKSKLLHDLRIACRRGETALDACARILVDPKLVAIQHQMRQIRRLCNPLRDNEVFLKWLQRQPENAARQKLVKSVSQAIKEAYPDVAERARKIVHQHRLQREIQKLSRAEPGSRDLGGKAEPERDLTTDLSGLSRWRRPLGQWLFHMMNKLIQEFPDDHDNFNALHQLRIAAKQLRYGMEFTAELDPKLKLQGTLDLLQEMQEKLGELHDAVVRDGRLHKEYHHLHRHGDELLVAARDGLRDRLADWKAWWQLPVQKQLLKQSVTEVSKLLT